MDTSNKLNTLKKLLIIYDTKWRNILSEKGAVVEYNFFNKKSADVVSLFEFRNSRNKDQVKIEKINSIVESIKSNNEEFIIIHHLVMTKKRDAFIYSNLTCTKTLGILSLGLEDSPPPL